MVLKQKQFIELDFTGKTKDNNEIFDTTLQSEAKNLGTDVKVKPMKICIGEGMLLEKFDKSLEGKEIGKQYSIELSPKESFGERKRELIKMIPLKIFTEKGVMPFRGLVLNMDGMIVKIVSVSSGRVITDFNNPLAGKSIFYEYKINRVIEDKKEQIEILLENLLRINPSNVKIEIKDNKASLEFSLKEEEFKILKELSKPFSEKVKSLVNLDLEMKNSQKNKEDKK